MSSPSTEPVATALTRVRAGGAAYFAALKLPLTLAFILAAVLAAYYIFYVIDERDYLIGRNFRLLATMADQIENAIESHRRVLANTLDSERYRSLEIASESLKTDAKYIPFLRSADIRPSSELSGRSPENVTVQFVDRTSQKQWFVREVGPARPLFFRLTLEDLLQRVLGDQAPEATFDALVVATIGGRVLFQTGASTLRITDVARLTRPGDPKTRIGPAFEDLTRSPGTIDVLVAGARYKLFTQPCCGRIQEPTSGEAGWVLCGLTEQRTLSAASYSVPFSIMALIGTGMVLALLSWPFVKLLLIGEEQRIRAQDVALVGLCMLFGVAVITISALALYGYTALNARLDGQLEALADQIKGEARAEIRAATSQLALLDSAVANNRLPDGERVPNLAHVAPELIGAYPFFESFALIDGEGQQRRKMSLGEFLPPLVSVRDREYFQHWNRSAASSGFFFEAIQSKTTGRREVLLSKRATAGSFKVAALSIPMRTLINPVVVPGFGFVIIRDDGTVLFHSDPQHSRSENFFLESDNNRRLRALVRAQRTEWVDVKYWADDHRAFVTPMEVLGQKLTVVTLYDKALVRAVNIDWVVIVVVFLLLYMGVYTILSVMVLVVRPAYRAPWLWPDPAGSKHYLDLLPPLLLLTLAFVVAIAAIDPGELLVIGWLLPFVAWVVVYVVLGARRDWRRLVWPAVIGAALLVPLLLLVSQASPLRWGVLVGVLTLGSAVQAVIAARRRESSGPSSLAPPPNLSYGLAGGLLVVLVAVLPAVAFARVGHSMQIENFIKYGQRQAAVNRTDRSAREAQDALGEKLRDVRRQVGGDKWGIYDSFFFPTDAEDLRDASLTHRDTRLPELIEELLPFYSESSVQLRELSHDASAERDWHWVHSGDDLVFRSSEAGEFSFRSTLPGLLELSPRGLPAGDRTSAAGMLGPRLLLLIVGAIGILAAVICGVKFVIYNVFVADVIEPLWSGRDSPRETWAPNLFLVSPRPHAQKLRRGSYCAIDLMEAPAAEPELRRWFDQEFERVQRSPAGDSVLIVHFEERLDDPALNTCRLVLLERIINNLNRTIVVVSAVPPSAATGGTLAAEGDDRGAPAADAVVRWADVLSHFTIIPATAVEPARVGPSAASALTKWTAAGWREMVWRMNVLGFAHGAKFLDKERDDPSVDRLWKEVLPYAWHPDRPPLDLGQLLTEVGERAENHYREIWATCTPAEKLVLVHLAQEGLVNRRTRATVRRLMARGLILREPNFVLANETFRRFVLSSVSQNEVALLESSSASTWNAVRLPFLGVLLASLTFLFVTQHELFNTTLGVLTAVTAAIPTVMKMASLFGDRRTGG